MAKLDKLKIEADILKGYLFFILGFIAMLITGIGTQALKILDGDMGGVALFAIIVLLFILTLSGIMFLKTRAKLLNVLREIEKE